MSNDDQLIISQTVFFKRIHMKRVKIHKYCTITSNPWNILSRVFVVKQETCFTFQNPLQYRKGEKL